MRKLLTILASLLLSAGFISCESRDDTVGIAKDTHKKYQFENNQGNCLYLYEVDSCEYFIGGDGRMSHRARCKYCEARRKEELKQLVKDIRNGSEDVDLW